MAKIYKKYFVIIASFVLVSKHYFLLESLNLSVGDITHKSAGRKSKMEHAYNFYCEITI